MNIWSFLIGFGGLIIGGLSVYLAFKSRISSFREKIYLKQIEGFVEIIIAINDFHNFAQNFIATNKWTLNDKKKSLLRSKSLDKNLKLHYILQKWVIFFPVQFNEAVTKFIESFNAITAPSFAKHIYPQNIVNTKDPGKIIGNAYLHIIKIARIYLGTEPLSQDILKLLGKLPRSLKE